MKIIYPGTFDPISLGHQNLILRASNMFEEIVIAVSDSKAKRTLFTHEERVEMVKLATMDVPNARVVGFNGLLVDLMQENGINYVLRGIRGMLDFEYEFQMAQVNRNMLHTYEPIFLVPSKQYMVLSSTIIREVAAYGGDISSFLPPKVAEYIAPLASRFLYE